MGLMLSIIVPVYNVEKYLSKCVDSLLDQDIDDYEIIMVDDGSTDGSSSIMDSYATNPKIKLFRQPNAGLGAARNTGIRLAEGEYIQFVDSDDFIEPRVLGKIVGLMESQELEVLRFNYQNVNERYEVYQPYKEARSFVNYDCGVCSGLAFLTESLGYECYACQFMIKRELIVENSFFFKEGVYFEDTEWTPRVLSKALRVASTGTIVYDYLTRQGSITNATTMERRRKVLEDKYTLINCLQEQKKGIDDTRWFDGMIAHTSLSILKDISRCFYSERADLIGNLKVFPLSSYHATANTRRKYKFANLSPRLFCLTCHLMNLL